MKIEDIKKLKELTGVGLTDAKKALQEADGDFDKALKEMRKKGLTKADKRGAREARQGVIYTYNHDSRIGVVVEVNCETDFVARNEAFTALAKDVAMHIAASNPEYVSKEDIPTEVREAKKQELTESDSLKSKPDDVKEKIVEGQLSKYFSERCLLDQPFIKDSDKTVGDFVREHNAKLGENILVRRFSRIALGEAS